MPVILDILSSGPAPISTFNCDFDTDYSQYFHTDVILSCIWSMIQISGHVFCVSTPVTDLVMTTVRMTGPGSGKVAHVPCSPLLMGN